MDNQPRKETAELRAAPVSKAEQDRLSDLAHKVTVRIVKAIVETQSRELDSHTRLALALIDSKDENREPYILQIVNEGMRLAEEQLSKPWTTDELVPVGPLPKWDSKGLLNDTMTHQQKNAMVDPAPRLLYDILMIHNHQSLITLAEAVLRPNQSIMATIGVLLNGPRPNQEEVMAKIVKAYTHDMAVYLRREMEKPTAAPTISTPEELKKADDMLTNLGGGEEVRV